MSQFETETIAGRAGYSILDTASRICADYPRTEAVSRLDAVPAHSAARLLRRLLASFLSWRAPRIYDAMLSLDNGCGVVESARRTFYPIRPANTTNSALPTAGGNRHDLHHDSNHLKIKKARLPETQLPYYNSELVGKFFSCWP